MRTMTWDARLSLMTLAAVVLATAACSIDVREHGNGGKADVDIRTLVGDVTVRADTNAQDTGLPVYPGARVLHDHGEQPGSADVRVGSALFGLRVVAAKFESDDGQEAVLEFYRNELEAYGAVTECRGNVDFRHRGGVPQPVCDEKVFARDIQLVAGRERDRHIVSVKPRAAGSEFALVHIQMNGES